MANKRDLKKSINLICEELFVECIAASLYGAEGVKANGDAVLASIIKTESDFVSRVSHPEPGMSPAKYYRDLRENFSAQVGELIDQIANL